MKVKYFLHVVIEGITKYTLKLLTEKLVGPPNKNVLSVSVNKTVGIL